MGWQKQTSSATITIQGIIEKIFSDVLREPIELVGCSNIAAGIHAKCYFAHFDTQKELDMRFMERVLCRLPLNIRLCRIVLTHSEAHACFDVHQYAYEYHLTKFIAPFNVENVYFFPLLDHLDVGAMQRTMNTLSSFDNFASICGVKHANSLNTLICGLNRAEWSADRNNGKLIFYVAANKLPAGMISFLVGISLEVGLGRLQVADVYNALRTQTVLHTNFNAPLHGLYLAEVSYPYL